MSADGKTQIGLGTDVGGLAMCYRTDLFEKAGLPTDRDAVSKLWPTWDDFINVGKTVRRQDRQEVRRLRHQHVQPGARPAAASASTTSTSSCRWTAAPRSRSTSA